jgi:hypothetical protein
MQPRVTPVAITPHLSCDEEAAAAFRIGLVAATRETFGKHGFAAFNYTRPAAAVHEAGHALVYAALGPRPIRVSLERRFYEIGGVTKAFWGGACQTDRKSFTIDTQFTGPHEYFRELAFIAAGAIAEQRSAPGGLAPGSSLDERVMAGMLCHTAETAFGLPENAAGCLVKEIVTTLLDDFEQVRAKLSRRLLNSKVLRRAELDRALAPVTAARGANEAKFKSLIDDFLRLAASTSAEGSAL